MDNTLDPKFDLVLIGHFAQDCIRRGDSPEEQHSIGGGVTFGSISIITFDKSAKVGIVSKAGKNFIPNLGNLRARGIDLGGVDLENSHTTSFYHHYIGRVRKSKIMAKSPAIRFQDIPETYYGSKAVHFTPIAGEFDLPLLEGVLASLKFQDSLFGLDIQGLIRIVREDGGVSLKSDAEFNQKLFTTLQKFGNCLYFKGSDEEILAVSPNRKNDLIKATEQLGLSGAHILTTLGSDGMYYKAPGEEIIHIPAFTPKKVVDETGAGDVAMANLLYQLGAMPADQRTPTNTIRAIKIASAAVSFLVEGPGPEGCVTRNLVLKRMNGGI